MRKILLDIKERVSMLINSIKNNKAKLYPVFIIVLVLFVVFLNSSFGYFKKRIEGTKLTFNVGTLNYELECVDLENCEVVIPANESEVVNLNLTSLNKIDTKYELYYEVVSPTSTENIIDGGHLLTDDLTNLGEIQKNDTKNISLVLNNTGNEEVTLKLGIAPSLKNNEPKLEENQVSLNEIAYQKYYVYDYTGDYETFVAPTTGTYKIELWGAQGGGDETYNGGKGAYTSGLISLENNQELFVYVGENGTNTTTTVFNNGSDSLYTSFHDDSGYSYAGGGSTDVRLIQGTWDSFESIKSRIMVAAGGGGAQTYYTSFNGGAAGGLIGYSGGIVGSDGRVATGGTQTSGGNNGLGANTPGSNETNSFGKVEFISSNSGRGGNGYYSGGNGAHGSGTVGSGAGGSSFISGHKGCDAISETSTEGNIIHTGDNKHYMGYSFTSTIMIDGEGYNWTTEKGEMMEMPSHDLVSAITGNTGNGFARITLMEVGEGSGYIIESEDETGTTISIKPNNSKELTLNLTNTNEENSYYELYYEVLTPKNTENNIDGGYISISESTANELVEAGKTKSISLVINNTGDDLIYIRIDAKNNGAINENKLEEHEISLNKKIVRKYYVYDYTGDEEEYQTFKASTTGNYQIELWGAGDEMTSRGAYVKGNMKLNENEELYIYVGGKSESCMPYTLCDGLSYNGGGAGDYFTPSHFNLRNRGGGGATDVRLISGAWNKKEGLSSRIMVAGGAGSGGAGDSSAGGLIGYTGSDYDNGTGGTQISGGTGSSQSGGFGYGGNAHTPYRDSPNNNDSYGGGSGYYGGGAGTSGSPSGTSNRRGSGGGGSSYISGHAGCIAITSEENQTPKVTTYSTIEDSYHYSGKVFTDTVMIDGRGYKWTTEIGELVNMPTHDLISTMTGNAGNGYARITYLTNDSYTIKYNANGGQGTMDSSKVYLNTNFTLSPNTFNKEGYLFKGWSLSSNSDEVVYKDKDSVIDLAPSNKEITLYAVWSNEFIVTYNSNNLISGLNDISDTENHTIRYNIQNDIVTVTGLNSHDAYGLTNGRIYLEADKEYIFSCGTDNIWSEEENMGMVEAYLMLNGENSTYCHMSSNVDYRFTPKVTGTYWLRLDVNELGRTAKFTNINISTNIKEKNVVFGKPYGEFPQIDREGYNLVGWYTDATGGKKITEDTIVTELTETLYARWEIE